MSIVMVLAMADDGTIGDAGGIPWRLPEDLKRFKAITMGKPLIVGRKTYESFPKRPLPGRTNIVVTRDAAY
jgi:dihydrofolate reductase